MAQHRIFTYIIFEKGNTFGLKYIMFSLKVHVFGILYVLYRYGETYVEFLAIKLF